MIDLSDSFQEALEHYPTISLEEMDSVELLRRKDTKYLLSATQLLQALELLDANYAVLSVDGRRSSRYETLYFDHPKHQLYFAHHSRKIRRHKVRKRSYVDSGLVFLEVKLKRKGLTDKRRLRLPNLGGMLDDPQLQFIAEQEVSPIDLKPSLFNRFDRITLVNRERTERLTLDWNIEMAPPILGAPSREAELTRWSGVCIAELKQSGINRRSPFARWAKASQIRPERISKYCMGLMEIQDGLKANRFKAKRRKLSKLKENAI